MRSSTFLALAATVAAQPNWSWNGRGCKQTSTVVPPPAYTSDSIRASNAPSAAGFSNPTYGLSRGGQAVCVDGYLAVSAATANNVQFNFAVPPNQTAATDVFLKYVTAGSPFLQSITVGKQSEGGVWSIRATLCTPKNNLAPTEVQLLTHGVGFDRTYWDLAPGYSYVDVAAAAGRATLFYDRLGVGESQKADPIQAVQAPLEVEIAHSIAVLLRSGAISGNAFQKVVGVGHSFGSIISEAVTSLYPTAFDAAVLTGFTLNASAVGAFTLGNNWAIANLNNPARFGDLNNGYLVSDTIISTQIGFFRLPEFSQAILQLADDTKQTVTFGEYFTLGAVGGLAPGFTGPVAVVNGDSDLPFCTGNCSYPFDLSSAVSVLYPNAAKFGTYLAYSTGHGLNLHYTATGAYNFIQNFLS